MQDRPSTQSKVTQDPILSPNAENMFDNVHSSTHSDNQRGGIDDIKNFNYSFNPIVYEHHQLALIPNKNRIVDYLERLIPI